MTDIDVKRYADDADADIDDYIVEHIDPEPEELRRLHRLTHLRLAYPQMSSGHLQGRLLAMLCRMVGARRVLELGTYSGYSALSMAEALPGDGMVDTIEQNDELEDFLREVFDGSPCGAKVRLHLGDALSVIHSELSSEMFDLCFIDAYKRRYADFYRAVFPLVRHGGLIVADNTLWNGKVVQPVRDTDLQTLGVMEFNDLVAADARVEKVILPMRDGLTIIRKK